ncbi:chaperonin 10-like protein [Gymnopilus junonius]|uniref:Chaperonin 10-like protein n=1 Tax=Gymnopilus junonius TaxID=109634 RepID=A0A9P5NCM4_GYMJU|nr:chaperonin 10-like protein [Gymnopilus junonius]
MSPVTLPSTTAAILYGPRDIRVEDRTLWPPSSGHAQVRVVSTGLCGSDLHYYSHGRNGDFAVRAPLVLGHEAAGIVTAVAPGVTHLRVGQRVAIEAGISCRSCNFCEKGRYNLCKGMRFCSSAARFPHIDGTLQTKMNHPAHVLHPIPDGVSFELAALAEPLSVLIHASRRAGLQANQSIMVFGVGAIGLLACTLARHRGASRVVAIDINPARLEFAKREGFADEVYCLPHPSSSSSHSHPSKTNGVSPQKPPSTPKEFADEQLRMAKESAAAALSAFGSSEGYDIVFECTGAESAIQMSIFCATTGGRVTLIGMGTRAAYLPLSTAALREVDILGSFRYANTYPEALELLSGTPSPSSSAESIPLPVLAAKLVTHRFELEDTKKAFDMLAKGTDETGGLVLKVMVGS